MSKISAKDLDDFFRKAGFHRHKQSHRGKGLYFSVGGYDITKEDAIAIYKVGIDFGAPEGDKSVQYTGHKQTRMPDGQTLIDWITPTVKQESQLHGVDIPTKEQMAVVVSAIRMHSIITHAAGYDQSELGKPDEITKYWPVESSIGRYFRDAAEETLRGER